MRRVAVTGIGIVSPIGNSAEDAFRNACAGRSGVGLLQTAFSHRLKAPLGATVQGDVSGGFEPAKLRMLDRFSLFALVAANQAVAGCGGGVEFARADPTRTGVFVGNGMGGTHSMDDGYQTLYGEGSDRIKPFTVLLGMHNAAAAWIGIEHEVRGPVLTYSTACSSSAVAIGEAWQRIAHGDLDRAIAGGAEAPLSNGSLKAWEALHTLAEIDTADPSASCKPFAADRSGMVLGEGAAMLVLEPWDDACARGARIHGEILGYAATNEATHITRPGARGQADAMKAALRSAALEPQAIDAINAHGTGTRANDSCETQAIKAVFGDRAGRIPVSATKAIHGHLLGAAGALEAVLSLLAMQHGVALPTMHLKMNDAECDLDYVPGVARPMAVRTMLSNSFAFGGTNAVLVLGAAG
ncbi:MAG: beta-ketoacyl-[acyl-carrier-protein] synthase family protein [Variovorax sp.]